MIEIILASAIVIALAIGMAVRRTKRRRNSNPSDIYPLW